MDCRSLGRFSHKYTVDVGALRLSWPMDPAQLLQSAIVALENVVITRYISVQVLLYDHLLTLDDEVRYVWSAPTTLAKVLFLVMRYMVPLFMTGEIITRSGVVIIPMSNLTYAGWLSIAISNFLVLLRIWTTLPRGHRFIVWSLAFFVTMQLVNFAVTTWVITNMISVLYFEPTVGLCSFSSKPSVVGLWAPGLAFEIVVFASVCWNVLDRTRTAGPADPEANITRILFRDGVIYFVVPFRIANAVIAVVAPISSLFVIVFFIWSGVTVTTSRLIINSRREMGKAAKLRELQMNGGQLEEREGTDPTTDTLELVERESMSVSGWVSL
ncbi:hypothetical protein C8F04DRAFT_1091957 [Mycena alexandri]|uniref:DUF6533 domain-containing protein n=1 Tax=Mycena alexandri TaxID=1745969 RepID=A0AAD6T0Y9_9AGAR|nr:hypothetical protein C8F04DRAFT_1091957 [Mycena alexandri]